MILACGQMSEAPAIVPPVPPILTSDLRWFPPREVAYANWQFSLAHYQWVQQQHEIFQHTASEQDDWAAWLEDARYCYRCWDTLDNCQRGFGELPDQLAQLRCLLGQRNYWSGRMPPVVPVWHFRRLP